MKVIKIIILSVFAIVLYFIFTVIFMAYFGGMELNFFLDLLWQFVLPIFSTYMVIYLLNKGVFKVESNSFNKTALFSYIIFFVLLILMLGFAFVG